MIYCWCATKGDEGGVIIPEAKIIGSRIRTLREKRKLTQKQLAERIGVSDSAIGMYESGERIPRDEIKVKISSVLGKSVHYIFFKE